MRRVQRNKSTRVWSDAVEVSAYREVQLLIWPAFLDFESTAGSKQILPVSDHRFIRVKPWGTHQIVCVAQFSETMPIVSLIPHHHFGVSPGLTSAATSQAHSLGNAYRDALQTCFKNPSFCANLLSASSLSPIALTNPQRAYVWFSPVYRPFSSTFATEIWTEAWSLALIMRLVALHLRGT